MARFQFSVRQLLVLTTATAMILGFIVALDLPPILQPGVIASYFIYLIGWLVVRGPAMAAGWNEWQVRRDRLREQRRHLELEIATKRTAWRTEQAESAKPLSQPHRDGSQ